MRMIFDEMRRFRHVNPNDNEHVPKLLGEG